MTVIMDGRLVAARIKEKLRDEAAFLRDRGLQPKLVTILVGDDPASEVYLQAKHNGCSEVGIASENIKLPEDAEESTVVQLIERLNADDAVHGILLQLPLPSRLDENSILGKITPDKDVDGLHPYNLGKLVAGRGELIPCTPKGVIALLKHYGVNMQGAKVTIVNRSILVGKPLVHLFLAEDATIKVCHSRTHNLPQETSDADILVSAVGTRPRFAVTAEMVKEGAAVVDVAMNRVDGMLLGDVDFETVSKKASHMTPVPGGVGPMTVVMLLENTLIATRLNSGLQNETPF